MDDGTLYSNWYVALIIAAVVVLIAATLLVLLWLAARRISKLAHETLNVVIEIKENTRSIWRLQETNKITKSIHLDSEEIKNNSQSLIEILQKTQNQ
jgi:predicted PurR-regulated permease PerM